MPRGESLLVVKSSSERIRYGVLQRAKGSERVTCVFAFEEDWSRNVVTPLTLILQDGVVLDVFRGRMTNQERLKNRLASLR